MAAGSGSGLAPNPPVRWPTGLRSEAVDWRFVGLWRPFLAIVAALGLPSLAAWGLLSIAGTPGALEGEDPLRAGILFTLYALAMAPFLGWFLLPLLWPLALVAAVRGWAGMLSVLGIALGVGLISVHFALHGDLTTEDPAALPFVIVALSIQGVTGWAVFWATMGLRRRGKTRAHAD